MHKTSEQIYIENIVEAFTNPLLKRINALQTELDTLKKAINYSQCCTELRDKETPNIEDWLKDNFKRLDRHSFTNTHEDTVWLRSELVEVYNQLHP